MLANLRRTIFVKVGVVGIALICLYFLWQKTQPIPSRFEQHTQKWNKRQEHFVLLWTHPWDREKEGIQDGLKVDDCLFTYDRSKLKEANAVVFHYSSLDNEKLPWQHYRDPTQFFVFYSIESPSYIRHAEKRDLKNFDNHFINWTMTYRRDADVYYPYVRYDEHMFNKPTDHTTRLLADKKELALWVVSNCDFSLGSKRRMEFVDTLIKAGLRVHRYGRCFHNSDEYNSWTLKQHRAYKFYLSFENALHCKDYITEKFWYNAIDAGRVPVVWGPSKSDVEQVAPPHSFIHAEDFATPKDLVDYLEYLDKHDDEYMAYFKWVQTPDSETKLRYRSFKDAHEQALCRKLKTDLQPKTYSSITSYIFHNEVKDCLL